MRRRRATTTATNNKATQKNLTIIFVKSVILI